MKKLPIKTVVQRLLDLQKEGKSATLLGIGPMSPNLLQASFELAKDDDFPLMFIASRNQVDADELGGGYVNGWNQETFTRDIKKIADEVGFDGLYYLCRDHGGPWQRDKERNDHLPVDKAMELGKKSYLADIEAGFDLLMIDPTKDPFEMGKVIPLDIVLERTVELIEYCEKERKRLNLPEIGYEVGTEETNGGLTSTETYETFITRLKVELEKRDLPMPTFIVGQTGTLTRKTEQVGTFNFKNAYDLAQMAKKYGVGLKEHNGDYLDDVTLLEHIPSQIIATNVAPQYGTEETRAYLKLAEVERKLKEEGLIEKTSNIRHVLLVDAIECGRWRKWVIGEQKNLTTEEIFKDEVLSNEILDIAGHYTFNNDDVKREIEMLYSNLRKNNINGQRFVVDHIKRPLRDYAECYNLKGVTTRILNK
ncbi:MULTISPECIES: class II D-tagatose-bisphosphate aldolase non-catalytic subunit [unclassified Clostridioides]|uniref:class II D-tagatose-bisphosphate aldolase non-catalytic subunit n=1 Tax=unclassified Clostridioides TaxID=2635829 RepID=UPI001D0C9620|nr:class II D-tagatose-bisphosphate aldolase, non-catalytic subunit [Clostridioides sp. ES-S-0049-03]MCC0677186.1 class II D-tagatose-bisphosphate aldolase, non-catalytic subunit [Clostridioides sp. ES-W-0018-02]MCC0712051.1 class II D-tagatose-bisphosphate aldolase, non-catalytic subunit [Clostridioides sp. ES-W-0017-02]MCC0763592.1 class II D-tagatose-bisphosphate aldolase, non-catalytic subunit [Clostridioides sp. ES-S-0006-03]UDN58207.1 class II D-tagatose-bisphosphate aldolase, non-catalyt